MISSVGRERVECNQDSFGRRAMPSDVPGAQGGSHLLADDVVSAVAVGCAEGIYDLALVNQFSDHGPRVETSRQESLLLTCAQAPANRGRKALMQPAFSFVEAQGGAGSVDVVCIDTGHGLTFVFKYQCLARHQHLDAAEDGALTQRLTEEHVFGQALLVDRFVLLGHLA